MCKRTAFGGMLQDIVELTSLLLRPEPLDDEMERPAGASSTEKKPISPGIDRTPKGQITNR